MNSDASSNGKAMVELKSVVKRFGDVTAVDRVSLSIRQGEFLTLLGPSGCGKTTLLRMISGFEVPCEGRVMLAGDDVTHLPPYRRDVNQVFQSYALFPHLSVFDNVAFGLRMKKVAKGDIDRRVGRVLELVSLRGLEERMPSQLSGGQKQRVALARAIVCEPKVLLLDEPLSALDAKLRHQMQLELKRLQKQLGITFIFVTHDQEEALTMSDRIAVVNLGRIEQLGSATEIYHDPSTTFVANFIGEANIVPAEVTTRNGTRVMVSAGPSIMLAVPAREVPEGVSRVLLSIRPEKIQLRQQAGEMENVFPALISEEMFRGATTEMTLQADGGLELSAVVANEGAGNERFAAGQRVYCHLHEDDIVVVRED